MWALPQGGAGLHRVHLTLTLTLIECHKVVLGFTECFWDPEMKAATVTTATEGEFWAFTSLYFSVGVPTLVAEIGCVRLFPFLACL